MATTSGPGIAERGHGLDLPKLTRSTLNDEVYDTLKDALIQGRIPPGATMTIRGLAESFGTSMMPVREALRRLVAEHILVLLPNRSVTLPVFTKEKFLETTRIRLALEGLASEEAARHISREDVAYMKEMTELMERPENWGAPASLAYNREFHFTLYKASGMPQLVAMIEGLWLQIGPLLNLPVTEKRDRRPASWHHHHAALDALNAKRPAKVRQAISADIEEAAKTISLRLASETT